MEIFHVCLTFALSHSGKVTAEVLFMVYQEVLPVSKDSTLFLCVFL